MATEYARWKAEIERKRVKVWEQAWKEAFPPQKPNLIRSFWKQAA